MVHTISSFSFFGLREFQRTDVHSETCNNVKMKDAIFPRLISDKLIIQIQYSYHYPADAHAASEKRFNVKLGLLSIFRVMKIRSVSRTFTKSEIELFVTKGNG